MIESFARPKKEVKKTEEISNFTDLIKLVSNKFPQLASFFEKKITPEILEKINNYFKSSESKVKDLLLKRMSKAESIMDFIRVSTMVINLGTAMLPDSKIEFNDTGENTSISVSYEEAKSLDTPVSGGEPEPVPESLSPEDLEEEGDGEDKRKSDFLEKVSEITETLKLKMGEMYETSEGKRARALLFGDMFVPTGNDMGEMWEDEEFLEKLKTTSGLPLDFDEEFDPKEAFEEDDKNNDYNPAYFLQTLNAIKTIFCNNDVVDLVKDFRENTLKDENVFYEMDLLEIRHQIINQLRKIVKFKPEFGLTEDQVSQIADEALGRKNVEDAVELLKNNLPLAFESAMHMYSSDKLHEYGESVSLADNTFNKLNG